MLSDMMLALPVATTQHAPSGLTVFLLGLGSVFLGLICIVFIILALGYAFNPNRGRKLKNTAQTPNTVAPVMSANQTEYKPDTYLSSEDRQQVIAAVSAAIAEYMGKDVSGLRIHSIKRI